MKPAVIEAVSGAARRSTGRPAVTIEPGSPAELLAVPAPGAVLMLVTLGGQLEPQPRHIRPAVLAVTRRGALRLDHDG